MLVAALEREREQVRQEGIEIGEARGVTKRTQEIVRAMHQKGFALDVIAEITGLSPTEVERLVTITPSAMPDNGQKDTSAG